MKSAAEWRYEYEYLTQERINPGSMLDDILKDLEESQEENRYLKQVIATQENVDVEI